MKFARKRPFIFSGVALALAGVVVGTFAVSQNSTVLNNVFEIADYETTFTEEFQAPSNWKTCDTVDKKIYVKNDTDVYIFARIKLEEEWTDANGMGLPLVSNGSGEKMALINMTNNSGWTLDGTYYYSSALAPGATSSSVISGVTLNCDANLDEDYRYGNAQYKLSAKIETIQADRVAAEWHKKSVWQPIATVKAKLKNLRPSRTGDTRTRKFLQADSLGIDPDNATSDNIISIISSESNTPTYMWYDEDEDTMYWYSDADDVYLTADGSGSQTLDQFYYYSDISGFYNVNTSRATNMNGIFWGYGGTSLHGLEKWDVSGVTSLKDFVYQSGDGNVSDVTALARWDVSGVQNMAYMFAGEKIADVSPLSGWNVGNVQDFTSFLYGDLTDESICTLADWDVGSVNYKDYNGMFSAPAKDTRVDATCLNDWNVDLSHGKINGAFSYRAFIYPSWAM